MKNIFSSMVTYVFFLFSDALCLVSGVGTRKTEVGRFDHYEDGRRLMPIDQRQMLDDRLKTLRKD